MILEKLYLKIERLRTEIKSFYTKPVLFDLDVLYLATLHRKYVVSPIDKATTIHKIFESNSSFHVK